MERSTLLKFGKPSISMGHLYHGELLVITRGYIYMNVFLVSPVVVGWYQKTIQRMSKTTHLVDWPRFVDHVPWKSPSIISCHQSSLITIVVVDFLLGKLSQIIASNPWIQTSFHGSRYRWVMVYLHCMNGGYIIFEHSIPLQFCLDRLLFHVLHTYVGSWVWLSWWYHCDCLLEHVFDHHYVLTFMDILL